MRLAPMYERHVHRTEVDATSAARFEPEVPGPGWDRRPFTADNTGVADLVWCKEVLMFCDLDRVMTEFARVLAPTGVGFAYQVFTGPRMTDDEARRFWQDDLAYGDARVQRPGDMQAAIEAAGMVVRQREEFAGEWGEYAEEHNGSAGRRLVYAARLLRDPARYIARYGDTNYRIMLGDCLWHVYRMIGMLAGTAFIFGPAA